jgi:hypothetical protein
MKGLRFLVALIVIGLTGACTSTGQEGGAAKADDEEIELQDIDLGLTHNIGDEGESPRTEFSESKGWKISDFTDSGEVRVEDGTAYLAPGNDMTGITWRGRLVRMNYEVSLDAKRTEGSDFFCGLTFPYGEEPCSFIVGGWGGTCVGISSIDYYDAYNNETARFREFETDRWYRIRVRVTPEKIEAWIDDEQMVDIETKGRTIGIRWEVQPSVPLGVATWRTGGAVRNVKIHAFAPAP